MHVASRYGLRADNDAWRVQGVLVNFLETAWEKPDEGIWEVRGPRRPFVHSRMMAWVAVDRAVKTIESHGAVGPLEKWRALRAHPRRRVPAGIQLVARRLRPVLWI